MPTKDLNAPAPAPSSTPVVKADSAEVFIKKVERSFSDRKKIEQGIAGAQKNIFVNKLAVSKDIESKMPQMHLLLSKLPEETRAAVNFLKPGDSVVDTNKKVIQKNIDTIKTNSVKKIKLSLSAEDIAKLKNNYADLKNIRQKDFDTYVFGASIPSQRKTTAYKQLPMLSACSSSNSGPALPPSPATPPPVVGSNFLPATKEDIYKNISSLLGELTSPEFAPVVSVHRRANEADVQASVNAFQFNGGPADQPAFYDFYSLQIAFEHVWEEVFDQSIQTLVKQAYEHIVNNQVDLPANQPADVRTFSAHLYNYLSAFDTSKSDPPVNVLKSFIITAEEWGQLNPEQRTELENLATDNSPFSILPGIQSGNNIINYAKEKLKSISKQQLTRKIDYSSLSSILTQLDQKLKEKYAFTIFAANEKERSVNFGIVLNYRQKWTPLAYQAGELIKTIPMMPGAVMKYSRKKSHKKNRSEKDLASTSSKSSFESSDTTRSEAEVIEKAIKKVNTNVSAKAGYSSSWSPWSFSVEASYGKEASVDSSQTKKDFREAVVRSAQELKNDRSVEINTSESVDFESEESGEIANKNDEIAVTYLFYELQRRYRLNESLNKISPVVMVAQEVPTPEQIDEEWIICYHWILDRVILDPSFKPALYYVASKVIGDEYALEEQRKNLDDQREMVQQLQEEFLAIKQQLNRDYKAMEGSIENRIEAAESRHHSFWRQIDDLSSGKVQYLDIAKMREEAAREEYDKAVKDENERRARLEREVTALQAATDNYTRSISDHLNRKAEIKKLEVHIKDNILYYMQAIWTFEPSDQRYFRLYQTKVPVLDGDKIYSLADTNGAPAYPHWDKPTFTFEVKCELNPEITYKTLVELADVDNLLGFKGNYMIFPLKESNVLTDYLMAPYINKYSGISDPDPAGAWSLDDFNTYISCLKKQLDNNEITQAQFDSYKPALTDLYKQLITDPLRENEEIVIPTNSLFIEALPGVHPILEDFKLMHRAIDVKKVQAEVRLAEMENLRSAARLVSDQLEDPGIEKKIVIEGKTDGLVAPITDN